MEKSVVACVAGVGAVVLGACFELPTSTPSRQPEATAARPTATAAAPGPEEVEAARDRARVSVPTGVFYMEGPLATKATQPVVTGMQDALLRCYHNALARSTKVAGVARVTVRLGPGGKATKVDVDPDPSMDAGFVKCLAARAAAASFPEVPNALPNAWGKIAFSATFELAAHDAARPTAPTSSGVPTPIITAEETSRWESYRAKKTASSYLEFLSKYPASPYACEARFNLNELGGGEVVKLAQEVPTGSADCDAGRGMLSQSFVVSHRQIVGKKLAGKCPAKVRLAFDVKNPSDVPLLVEPRYGGEPSYAVVPPRATTRVTVNSACRPTGDPRIAVAGSTATLTFTKCAWAGSMRLHPLGDEAKDGKGLLVATPRDSAAALQFLEANPTSELSFALADVIIADRRASARARGTSGSVEGWYRTRGKAPLRVKDGRPFLDLALVRNGNTFLAWLFISAYPWDAWGVNRQLPVAVAVYRGTERNDTIEFEPIGSTMRTCGHEDSSRFGAVGDNHAPVAFTAKPLMIDKGTAALAVGAEKWPQRD